MCIFRDLSSRFQVWFRQQNMCGLYAHRWHTYNHLPMLQASTEVEFTLAVSFSCHRWHTYNHLPMLQASTEVGLALAVSFSCHRPLLMPVALISDCMCVICDRRKTQPVLTLPLLMPVALVSDCMCVICDIRKTQPVFVTDDTHTITYQCYRHQQR
jgi:hypothetical protein